MTNKINEDLFLISEELSKEDKIYRENYSSINTFLNNQYNQAIFGTNKIEISISDNSPANRGFYMRYAKILDMVQNANGHNEELTNANEDLTTANAELTAQVEKLSKKDKTADK